MSQHTLKAFDSDLDAIARQVMEMGALAQTQTAVAVKALVTHDIAAAAATRSADASIDALQRDIEEAAVQLLARHQPMADDLRTTIAAIRIAGALERIGDYAKNIAKRVISTAAKPYPEEAVVMLDKMSELAVAALGQVLTAYAWRDAERALAVWRDDAQIDALNRALFDRLIDEMARGAGDIAVGANLMFCAKNLERVGDHATNIAETVYYVVHGATLPERQTAGEGTMHSGASAGR
jgi:phosphate transport system protein